MLSTSNISDINYYINTKYFSLAKEQLLDDKQFAGSLINDLLIDQKFNKEDFTNLCKGKITTKDGEYIELGRKNKDGELDHDMGRDLTFSAPKSISLQHNMEGGDKRIKKALFTATKETLDYIERNYAFTRIKDESGKIKLIKTGNFSASLLYENLNRNLEFDDHIHCTIFNATKRNDGNIRSLEFRKIIENKMHFGMIFRMNLANQIQKLGYEIEITDKKYNFFEIKGFNKNISKEFSGRTEEINKKAFELNQNPNAKTKELANLLTRNDKILSVSSVKEAINERLDKLYVKYNLTKEEIIENIKSLIFKSKNPPKSNFNNNKKIDNVKTSIAKVIDHLSERKSYFSREEIVNHASIVSFSNKKIFSSLDAEKTIDKLINKKFLIKTGISNANHQLCYGTRESLEREKAIISICYEGKNKFNSISSIKDIDHYFKLQEQEHNIKLTKGQLDAVKLIINCKDQFSIIQGYAGVGKTFAIGMAKKYLDHINNLTDSDHQIIGLAPSGSAAKELESVIGKADTLQYFLKKNDKYANGRVTIDEIEKEKTLYKNKIILIDESSMIGSSQMNDLLNISKIFNLKLAFLGDKSQELSIESGIPFHQMQKEDLKIAKMTDIVRQNNQIAKAIAYSSYAKDFESVFKKVGSNFLDCSNHPELLDLDYSEKNKKYYVSNDHTAKAAAILYHDFNKKEQENTLLITPSNSTRHLINQYVRDQLPLNKDKSITKNILTNENLTIAQKSNYYFYEKNHILLFNKAIRRFNINKNEYFKVSKINDNNQTLLLESINNKDEHNKGKLVIFDPAKANSLLENIEIYKQEARQYCQNEKIIFTRKTEEANQFKDKHKDKENKLEIPKLINSTIATITNIDRESNHMALQISDSNEIINLDLNHDDHKHILSHSDYGYCLTNYKSQGKTQNNVIIVLESYFKHLADARNTLVAVTRAKDNIHIITDSKEELIKQIANNYENKRSDETAMINARYNNNSLLAEKITLKENLFKQLKSQNSYNKYQLALSNNQDFNKFYSKQRDITRTKELSTENINPNLTKSDNFTGTSIDKIIEPHKNLFVISEEEKKAKINESFKQIQLRQKASLTDVENKYNKKGKAQSIRSNKSDKSTKTTTKLSYQDKRQYILNNLPDHEIKQHLTNEIINNFNNSDLSKMDQAIDSAFNNQSHSYRFGKNNSLSLIWHGKAGYIRDFRTDDDLRWGIGNIKLTDTEKTLYGLNDNELKDKNKIQEIKSKIKTKEQIESQSQQRKTEQKLQNKINYNNKAKEAEKLFNYHKNQKINQDPKLREERIKNHSYLKEKNLNNNKKILNNKNDIIITKDNRLLISAKNKDNQIRTIQSIDAKGNKRFLKGAEKQGNFFLIKGTAKENEKTIYLAEGVATAISINQATNCPTIACFDAGNIEKTLKELTTKFKDKNFIIAADNDRFKRNKETNKIEEKSQNTGKQKAIETAKKYNAKVILPHFKNPENKDHIKLLSDFNDLHKHYGIDHLKEQLHNKENYLHLEGVKNYSKNIEIVK
ncbi:relaxase domain-containing protein [Rickettsiales bacterium]|nr:relaxase domain-containing protein [Rickettsiales bacterium]